MLPKSHLIFSRRCRVENNRLEGQVDRLQEINSNLEQTKNKLSEENDKTEGELALAR